MTYRNPPLSARRAGALFAAAMVVVLCACGVPAADDLADGPVVALGPRPWSELRQQTLDWIRTQSSDSTLIAAAEALWSAPTVGGGDRLTAVAETAALLDPRAAALVATSRAFDAAAVPLDTTWLADDRQGDWMPSQLTVFWGRALTQARYFDEAAALLEAVPAERCCDPASLLFYRSISHQQLLQADQARADLDVLLHDVAEVPGRFRTVADLIVRDIEALEVGSLDHISRRMRDIERRLDHGQVDPRLQDQESQVLADLDRMIDELEQQQQQSSSSSQGAAAEGQGTVPTAQQAAAISRAAGGRGPGEVEPRPLSRRGDWGDLPPKTRDEALQQIGRDFPAHYRDAVEQYFRRLAGEQPQESP